MYATAAAARKGPVAADDVETQSVGGSCSAGSPSSQSAGGQSLVYGLQVSRRPSCDGHL